MLQGFQYYLIKMKCLEFCKHLSNCSVQNLLCLLRASSPILGRDTQSCLQKRETLQVRKGKGGVRHSPSSRSPPARGAVGVVCKKECAPCSLSVDVLPLSLIPPYVSCAWTGDCSLITEMGPDNGVYTWCRTGNIGGERE